MISAEVLDKLGIGPCWCFRGWQFRIRDTPYFVKFGTFDCFLQHTKVKVDLQLYLPLAFWPWAHHIKYREPKGFDRIEIFLIQLDREARTQ